MHLRLARNESGEPEVFRSIQGEGPNIGRQRTFIRLSGCNLHCTWCDTAYTWNWLGSPFTHDRDAPGKPFKFDPAAEMEKVSIEDAVALIQAQPSEGVVITGGEPMMQSTALAGLIDALKVASPAQQIEMETNGSIAPSEDLAARLDLFIVSPKLAHSGNDPAVALNERALSAFARLPQAVFKFVARTSVDIDAVAALAARYNIASARVYIMPEGTSSGEVMERGRALIDTVLSRGFNFTDRLHIHLFGQRRGV